MKDRNELLAHEWLGGAEERKETIAYSSLLIFGYRRLCRLLLGGVPSAVDAVLDIDDRYNLA